jgi:hypothetical protein
LCVARRLSRRCEEVLFFGTAIGGEMVATKAPRLGSARCLR